MRQHHLYQPERLCKGFRDHEKKSMTQRDWRWTRLRTEIREMDAFARVN